MKLTYAVVFEQMPNNYGAYVPHVPGCVSVGDTWDEMRAMMPGSPFAFHIEDLLEQGEPSSPRAEESSARRSARLPTTTNPSPRTSSSPTPSTVTTPPSLDENELVEIEVPAPQPAIQAEMTMIPEALAVPIDGSGWSSANLPEPMSIATRSPSTTNPSPRASSSPTPSTATTPPCSRRGSSLWRSRSRRRRTAQAAIRGGKTLPRRSPATVGTGCDGGSGAVVNGRAFKPSAWGQIRLADRSDPEPYKRGSSATTMTAKWATTT